MGTPRASIAITGMGAVSALGVGVPALVAALRDGQDGLRIFERIDLGAIHPVRYGGEVREEGGVLAWSRRAAREAFDEARGGEAGVARERIAVVVGTTTGEEGHLSRLAEEVGEALGARGPRLTISTACASGTNAIGLGAELLLGGDADLVIAGGAEQLSGAMFAGFFALEVLAGEKCAPFGETLGTTLGEGAGFVVLERDRGRVPALGYLAGYGLSGDAYHETTPDPRGDGIARAMQGCLLDAGLAADEVEYVNAHATGTASNDDSEWRGIQKALGERAHAIPVSATKGFLGHAQGAAGALEAIATLACMRAGRIPGSLRVGRGRLRGPTDPVREGHAREGVVSIALSNSAAFGGANASLAIVRSAQTREAGAQRSVRISGVGLQLTEAGTARDERAIALACGDADLRALDPSGRFAVAATRRALDAAGVRVRGALRDRLGIFGATRRAPYASVREFEESLERGHDRASAPAFARTVPHAPVGSAARALGLRGPTTLVAGPGFEGLLAIAYAARWLRARADADAIVAGAIDEREGEGLTREGAAMVLLTAVDVAGAGPRVAGVALAGTADAAVERALAEAGRRADEVGAVFSPDASDLTPLGSTLAFVRAVEAGRVEAGLEVAVACAEGPLGAVAIVLERDPAP